MAPSERSSQSGRGRPLVVELGCLDGALPEGLSLNRRRREPPSDGRTRRRWESSSAQPGWVGRGIASAAGPRLRRGALAFGSQIVFGRKQHLVIRAMQPGADRSLSRRGPLGSATTHEPTKACVVKAPKDLPLT